MKESKIPTAWFSKYMNHVANNIINRDGEIRFSYQQLRATLDAVEAGRDDIDEEVRTLLRNIIGALPDIDLSDRQVVILCLALLNCHMAYQLTNPDLVPYIRASINKPSKEDYND